MITPDNITALADDQIFVFGSNMLGNHSGGAAKIAHEKFGAEWGIGRGLTGQCYAFPTLSREMTRPFIDSIEKERDYLFSTARALPEKTFFLTKLGCGIAGFKEEEIAPLFKDAPTNVIKPLNW